MTSIDAVIQSPLRGSISIPDTISNKIYEKREVLWHTEEFRCRVPCCAVNVAIVAALRAARGGSGPDPSKRQQYAENRVHSVAVRLREDRQCVQDRDVFAINVRSRGILPRDSSLE